MALETLSTGAVFALCIGLVKVIEKLIEKLTAKKDGSAVTLKHIDGKIDGFAASLSNVTTSLAHVADSLDRQADTLDRLEARVNTVADTTLETKFRIVNGDRH